MTDRTLTITAAEWASVHDGTLWLVREGSDCTEGDHCYTAHDDNAQHPPAEFVQACAFCTACDARLWDRGHNRKTDCLDCRIELVGPCLACVSGEHSHEFGHPVTVTLGYAYAVGQPLPIYLAQSELVMAEGILIDLAHYGPPESLVGKWALTLAVTA